MSERKKIVVLADDFTGAAEIGGVGLRYGLSVAVTKEVVDSDDVDLLVVVTDTRSMPAQQASETTAFLTKKIMSLNPFFIYKKIDSVFRGHVSEEIEAQLKTMGLKRSIVVAANPTLKRIIRNGKYYINNVPLHETNFSTIEFESIKTNNVLQIINPSADYPVVCKNTEDVLPEEGLILGDVESLDDLSKWALLSNDTKTIFAGASGFFNAILNNLQPSKQEQQLKIPPFGEKTLFIFGSKYPKEQNIIDRMVKQGYYHSNMPREIYDNKQFEPEVFSHWVQDVVKSMKEQGKVIVSSIHSNSSDPDIYIRIKQIVARLVAEVFKQIIPDELLIEGGNTASEILDRLQIKRLTPVQELDTGVIRMQVDNRKNLYLTTKPGSYLWPEEVWMKEEIVKLNEETC